MSYIANNCEIDAIFLDCTKAFDRADHSGILTALSKLNVNPWFVRLISDYLKGRSQVTRVDDAKSPEIPVTSGVPQGSILGPILFIFLIHDVDKGISPGTTLKIFADDQLIYRVIFSVNDEKELQNDLDKLCENAQKKKLCFNARKSFHMRLSGRRCPSTPVSPYVIDRAEILSVPKVKYLGLEIDQNLSWRSHIDKLETKCHFRIRQINSMLRGRADRAKMQLFKSLVNPVTDYCSVVLNPPYQYQLEILEKTQMNFVRQLRVGVNSQENALESYLKRLEVLKWDPVIVRRIKCLLKLTFKLVSGLVPYGSQVFEAATVTGNTRCLITKPPMPYPSNRSHGQWGKNQALNKKSHSSDGCFMECCRNGC